MTESPDDIVGHKTFDTDPTGDLAHIITGSIASLCCFRTGGRGSDPKCECRAIAEQLIDYANEAIAALSTAAERIQKGK